MMHSIKFDRKIAWSLLVAGLLASAASSLFELYSKIWWFDEFLHFELIFALTLLVGLYGYGTVLTGARNHGVLLVLAIAGLGLALGAFWEIWEWVYDEIVRPNAILGKTDTIVDMIVGAIGAVVASYACLRTLGKGG
ncbi:MAG TPA: hypothetical protein VFE21_10210 [Rubrobacteraceae bacterium]|nr:hypothetical protein [Rubrobacteraceae bacterium]